MFPMEKETDYLEGTLVSVAAEITDPNVFIFAGWRGSAVQADGVADPNALETTVLVDDNYTLRACFLSRLDVIHVDDDANTDPGPFDAGVSDPLENGTEARPFDRIQEALEVASDQAIVRVYAGRYEEQIVFPPRCIRLMGYDPNSTSPESLPIIDANDMGSVVSFFREGEDPNASLSGFVLTRGDGVVYCEGRSPILTHCLLVGNRSGDPNTGMIECIDSNMVLLNCTLSDNLGTLVALHHSTLNLINSILWGTSLDQISMDGQSIFRQSYSDSSYIWPGEGNFSLDPLFHQSGTWEDQGDGEMVWDEGDYHLQSVFGRWDEVLGRWEFDTVTSPCIGAGDPNALLDQGYDSVQNVNCGVYGGTPMASKGEEL